MTKNARLSLQKNKKSYTKKRKNNLILQMQKMKTLLKKEEQLMLLLTLIQLNEMIRYGFYRTTRTNQRIINLEIRLFILVTPMPVGFRLVKQGIFVLLIKMKGRQLYSMKISKKKLFPTTKSSTSPAGITSFMNGTKKIILQGGMANS